MLVLLVFESDGDVQGDVAEVGVVVRYYFSIVVTENNTAEAGEYGASWLRCLDILASSHREEI